MSLEPTEILEHELPLRMRINNYLLAKEHWKLGELLDIPPEKCLDFCRETRAFADSIAYQIKISPSQERVEILRSALAKHIAEIIARVMAEKERHD